MYRWGVTLLLAFVPAEVRLRPASDTPRLEFPAETWPLLLRDVSFDKQGKDQFPERRGDMSRAREAA